MTSPPKPQPFSYPALDTPQHVVLNVKYSWERRDSVRTKEIYDDAYQGASTDNSNVTLDFTKADEVGIVHTMANDPNINSVSFTLPPENTWMRLTYATDPAGWTAIQLPGVNVQVDDAVQGTMIASHPSLFEFKLVPELDAASPTDTTWKVVRWKEVQ